MKIYDKKLAYPYFVWMVLFTVVPLFIVVYYALTDSAGSFTLDNLVTVSGYGSVFARSLLLALISTVVCLIIAFPVGYFLSRLRVNKQHIMLMLVMLYFMIYRPQKKQEKKDAAMRSSLEIGDQVTTIGGVIGRVVAIKDDTFVLETGADRVKIRFTKNAISSVEKLNMDNAPKK